MPHKTPKLTFKMKLIVKCPNCNTENKAPHTMDNRIDYAMKYGDNFSVKCVSCGETTTYHVDEIRAVDYSFSELLINKLLIFGVVYVATLVLGIYLVGAIGGIVISFVVILLAFFLAKRNDTSKNLTFNRHKLKRRMANVNLRK